MLVLFEVVTCALLKINYENLISYFVIHDQIQYISRDLHPKYHSSNTIIPKYNVSWMSIPMQLLYVKPNRKYKDYVYGGC